jgi:hypothetical protein
MRRVAAGLLATAMVMAIVAGFVPAAGATGASAVAVHCTPPGQGPSNDASLPIGLLTADNMSCRAAREAIRRGTFTVHGGCFGGPNAPPCHTRFTTRGFRCTAPRLGDIRCTDRARRFSFAWGE